VGLSETEAGALYAERTLESPLRGKQERRQEAIAFWRRGEINAVKKENVDGNSALILVTRGVDNPA